MIQGLYLAASGMIPMMDKQEQIANNLANINTTGFKESGLFLKTYQKYLANDHQDPYVNRDIKVDESYVNYAEGTPKKTGNTLDVMIKGSGFFTAMTSEGVRYTRNGNFSFDKDGMLVTSDGSKVLGTEGYIRVDLAKPVDITERGEVMQDGASKGFLRISEFQKPYKLLRSGDSFFKPELPQENPAFKGSGFKVMQGYLETSNVNIIRNMVQMISAYRNYEADQKAMQAQDETLLKAISEVGKV